MRRERASRGVRGVALGAEYLEMPSPGFCALVRRLSEASVRHRWEAYRDLDWEAPEHEVDRADPRWEARAEWDPLAVSEWYRDQSPTDRAAIGLYREVRILKVAIEFESVLSQGLLRFAAHLPCSHPALRYIYHEVSEEAQHSLMFQEFINRSGFDPPDAGEEVNALFRRVAEFGEDLPVLFFLNALSGEEAFDYLQRLVLSTPSTHPLMTRISRIHVTEEARHVSFARGYLRSVVPKLDHRAVRHLRYQVPFVIAWTAERMFEYSGALLSAWGMPEEARDSIVRHSSTDSIRRQSMERVVALCDELGLVDRRLASIWSKIS